MFDHIGLRVKDLDASVRFYTVALAPLGYEVTSQDESTAAFGSHGNSSLWLYADAKHSALERLEHCARAIAHSELGENARDVILDRALGRAEGCGDLAVAVPAGHEAHHLGFAHRERLARRFHVDVRCGAGTQQPL